MYALLETLFLLSLITPYGEFVNYNAQTPSVILWPDVTEKGKRVTNTPFSPNQYTLTIDKVLPYSVKPSSPPCVPFRMPGYLGPAFQNLWIVDGIPINNSYVFALACPQNGEWHIAVNAYIQYSVETDKRFTLPGCILMHGSAANRRDGWEVYACKVDGFDSNKYYVQTWSWLHKGSSK